MVTLVNNLLLSVLAVVGLVVLIAMGKVDSNVGVPIIAAIAGVHVGGQLGSESPAPAVPVVQAPTFPQSATPVTAVTGNTPATPGQ